MSQAETASERQRSGRRTLLALLAVFAAPMLLAWWFTSGSDGWRPDSSVARGELLEPTRDASAMQFQAVGAPAGSGAAQTLLQPYGKFTLLVMGTGPCEQACRELVDLQGRLWLLLGRKTDRVRPVVLSDRRIALPELIDGTRVPQQLLLGQPADIERLTAGRPGYELYVADYRGHVVLRYATKGEEAGVLKDLKRLLRATAS